MKEASKWQILIVKFLNKEANLFELDYLDTWLKDPENIIKFNKYVKTEYLINACMKNYNLENAKKAIDQKVKEQKSKKRLLRYSRFAIVASLLVLFGIATYTLGFNKAEIQVVEQSVEIESGSNKAILTLENGNEITLEKGKDYKLNNVTSNGEALVYDSSKQQTEDAIKYNYLTIPRGGQFNVLLSDGTRVWLNSDSKLKYPAVFPANATREIELVYGEAYLEVSPSTENKGTSFSVLSKGQEINVLGTHFNVRAYANDQEIATTLVEGKVRIKKGDVEKILNPNQQSIIRENEEDIFVSEIDALQEISWVKGMFTFNEESLQEIMKILSRWYDINVVFESAEMKNYIFTGVLERTGSFIDIINLIEATSENEVTFEVNEKTVTIK